MKYLLSLSVLSIILFLSCSSMRKHKRNFASLAGTSWQLSGGPNFKPEKVIASLSFDASGSIGGNTGCNTYGGKYAIDGNHLKLTQVISTMRGCFPKMQSEQMLLNALNKADRYQILRGKLILFQGEKELAEFTQTATK